MQINSKATLIIEPAQLEELGIVIEIMNEAAAWLHSRGITKQWPSPIPDDAWDFFRSQIEKGEVYLARLNGDTVGTFRFDWKDEDLWADDPEGGGYVHSFAIRPRAHGQGIGAAMLAWAKQHVREHGKKFLRLDCWGENEPLKKYYLGLGFTFVRYIPEEDWISATFQMEA